MKILLAALMLVMPPQSHDLSVLAPHVASAVLMTAFGPYLFVASANALLTMLLMVIHLVLLWALVNRLRFFAGSAFLPEVRGRTLYAGERKRDAREQRTRP